MLTTLDEYGGYHGAWVSSGNSRGLETGDSDSEDDDYDDIAYGTMARFVPTLVLERLRAEGEASRSRGSSGGASSAPNLSASDKAEGPNIPQVHELDAAVMVVDVSGFSGMCERFAQGLVPSAWRQRINGMPTSTLSSTVAGGDSSGANLPKVARRSGANDAGVVASLYRYSNENETKSFGAEGVRDALNTTLGDLILRVEKHGGDVLRIAGDALIVLFHQGSANISPAEMTELCATCTSCGSECATSMGMGDSGSQTSGSSSGSELSVHVGVGCGRVSCFHVGSDERGWQLVVSGELFGEQVAKALDASGAGEVVVSAAVWERLEAAGWCSDPVEDDLDGEPLGLRLIRGAPDASGMYVGGPLDEIPIMPGAGGIAPMPPIHVAGRGVSSPPFQRVHRRASHSGSGRFGPAGSVGGIPKPPRYRRHSRAVSLDVSVLPPTGSATLGARWRPSRRRLSLLEEVEAGLLSMGSRQVGQALRGYCPEPIRKGLVEERMGVLAEIQRVSVLFVGLSFRSRGIQTTPSAPAPSADGKESSGRKVLKAEALKSSPAATEAAAHEPDGKQLRFEEKLEVRDARSRSPLSIATALDAGEGKEAKSALDLLQGSFSLLQTIVGSHGGIIKELSVDDKGTVMVVGFGLSPQVGKLPAARATLCAMECTDRLRGLGLARCHAGIATGPVFCGSLGSEDRREFAMVSETVNLAQRLMSARKDKRLYPKFKPLPDAKTPAAKGQHQQGLSSRKGRHTPTSSSRNHGDSLAPGATRTSTAITTSPKGSSATVKADPFSLGGKKWPRGSERSVPRWIEHWNAKASMSSSRDETPKNMDLEPMPSGLPRLNGGKLVAPFADDERGAAASEAQEAQDTRPLDGTPGPRGTSILGSSTSWTQESEDGWVDPFNRWVVLECETLREAMKTDQLQFLELEAIGVKGKSQKVDLYAPGLTSDPPSPTPRGGADHGAASIITPPVLNRMLAPQASDGTTSSRERLSSHLADSAQKVIIHTRHHSSASDLDPARYRLKPPAKGWGSSASERSTSGGFSAGDAGSLGEGVTWPRPSHEVHVHTSVEEISMDGDALPPVSEPPMARSVSLPETRSRRPPLPEDAARLLASWRKAGSVEGRFGLRNSVESRAAEGFGGGFGLRGLGGGEVLSRGAFETLLPCIFHANAVHDEVSHILWARTGGRVSYLADLCRTFVGTDGRGLSGRGTGGGFGEVGEDGTWRLTLSEFAHVLKLASRVPPTAEGALRARLDKLPYVARQVVLRAVCVSVVAGVGQMDLLLHLLTHVAPFKKYWEAVVSQSSSPVPRNKRSGCRTPPRSIPGSLDSRRGSPKRSSPKRLSPTRSSGEIRREVRDHRAASYDAAHDGDAAADEVEAPGTSGGRAGVAQSRGRSQLLSCLNMLQSGGFLRVCEKDKTFICDDLMLVDQVYGSTPFKIRKALHKEAAKWLAERHSSSFRDRAQIMPLLISHLTQAHEEGRAQAMLALLKVLGGRFLDRWVLKHVKPKVPIKEYPENPIASEHLALCVLPAIPSLRGLAKAIRGAEIAGVVVGVALRLRSLRLKNTPSLMMGTALGALGMSAACSAPRIPSGTGANHAL